MHEQQPHSGDTGRQSFVEWKADLIKLGRQVALDESCRDGLREGRPITNTEAYALDAWIHSNPSDGELEMFRLIRGMDNARFDTWKKLFNCSGTGEEGPQGQSGKVDD